MTSEYLKRVLEYIGMDLAHKNFLNDIKLYEQSDSKAKRIYITKAEAVIEVLKNDQELLRRKYRLYVKLSSKGDGFRIYSWRTQGDQGSLRLNSQQLFKLTAKISHLYWVEKDIKFELKPFY
jgi:hypothetical protein